MTATIALARCIVKACPWRWHNGDDRLCPLHGDDGGVNLATRSAGFGVTMAAFDGERDGG